MAGSKGRKSNKPSAKRSGTRPPSGGSGASRKPTASKATVEEPADESSRASEAAGEQGAKASVSVPAAAVGSAKSRSAAARSAAARAAKEDVSDADGDTVSNGSKKSTAASSGAKGGKSARATAGGGDDGSSGASTGLAGRWPGFIRPWLGTVIRVALGAIWIIAGVEKVGDPSAFVRAVRAYDVVPEWFAKGIGYGLPYLEIAVGALLIIGIGTRIVAIASAFLLVVFLIGIIQASARGLQIECGCFGGGGSISEGADTTYTLDILRDIGLLILSLYLVVWPITKYAADDLVRKAGEDKVTGRVGVRRTKEAQRRLAELQAKRRKEASKRIVMVSAVAAVVLVGVGFIGVAVQSHRANVQAQQSQIVVPPIANGDGVLVGQADAPVTVDIYEDFICPYCKQFQELDGDAIDSAVKDGSANFRFHMLGFLDSRSSPAGYSSRAAAASMCMPDTATWEKYHDLLYENQPDEGSAGLTNAQLVTYATQVGATDKSVADCINDQTYKPWIAQVTDNASKDQVTGTPSVRINGEDVVGANGGVPLAEDLTNAIKSGHGTGDKSQGSKVWLIIVIIAVVIGVILVFVRGSSRDRNQGGPKNRNARNRR